LKNTQNQSKIIPQAITHSRVRFSVVLIFLLTYPTPVSREAKIYAKHKEKKPFRDFIDNVLIPQWEKGNTAEEKIVKELLEKIARPSARLHELTQAIRQDIKTSGRKHRWYKKECVHVEVFNLLS